jgi:hypothetical protein
MMRITRFLLGLGYAFSFGHARAQEASGRHLLDLVSDAHRASRDSVRTLSCRVTSVMKFEEAARPPQLCSGECWYTPDSIRLKTSEADGQHDILWTHNIRKSVSTRVRDGRKEVGAQLASFAEMHLHATADPFAVGLLSLNLPGTIKDAPFEGLVEKASRIGRIERRKAGGTNLVYVQLFFDRSVKVKQPWQVEVHLDAHVNYLVRKIVYIGTLDNGIIRRESEVSDFRECAPGIFFPTKVSGRTDLDGKRWATQTAEILDIVVNRPLPQDVFEFRYPEGVILSDTIAGSTYRVDAQGNPISPAIPFAGVPPPPAADGVAPAAGKETQDEPLPATRWILPVSVCLIIAGAMIAVVRRWKRRTQAAHL